jgi:hypothetical protein
MIEKFTECAKHEMEKGIENLDTKEMGEVADIIKDLCEAEYYAKISKAMDESEYGEDYDMNGPMGERRYYRGQPRDSRGRYMSGGRRMGYHEPMYHMTPEMYREHTPEHYRDMDRHEGRMYYTETGMDHFAGDGKMMRDSREGRSGMSRRTYMETKEMHPGNTPEDKQKKVHELEKYMNELATDVTEMISGATPEEKTMLKQKMQTLVQKIV